VKGPGEVQRKNRKRRTIRDSLCGPVLQIV